MSGEVECTFDEYIEHYLKNIAHKCSDKMPPYVHVCVEKVARPFFYWREACVRLKKHPEIP